MQQYRQDDAIYIIGKMNLVQRGNANMALLKRGRSVGSECAHICQSVIIDSCQLFRRLMAVG